MAGRRDVPETALNAISGVRQLEQEVGRLRAMLSPGMDRARKADIAALLGKVILFRLALANAGEGAGRAGPPSDNDETKHIKITGVGDEY